MLCLPFLAIYTLQSQHKWCICRTVPLCVALLSPCISLTPVYHIIVYCVYITLHVLFFDLLYNFRLVTVQSWEELFGVSWVLEHLVLN